MRDSSKASRFAVTLLFIIALSVQGIQPAVAKNGGDVRIKRHSQTGKVDFIAAAPGAPINIASARAPGLSQEERARAMIEPYAADLGLKHVKGELKLAKAKHSTGRQTTKFQQTYQGIPVMAGELVVNSDDQGGLLSINGELSPDLALDTKPAVNAEQAKQTALESLVQAYGGKPSEFKTTQPELWIYDARLLHPDATPPVLVWRMDVTSKDEGMPLRELVLVDAQRGSITLQFNHVDTFEETSPAARPAEPPAAAAFKAPADASAAEPLTLGSPIVQTYTMNNTWAPMPGTFVCDLTYTNCTDGVDPQADKAELYAYGIDQFYRSHFGRNGMDDANMPAILSVHFGSHYDNAGWMNGQMRFGDEYPYPYGDDVVGHEYTQGVIEYESQLYPMYQSGAISVSLSDVFGELYDQSNGLGTDTSGVKWTLAEDVVGKYPRRSMRFPTVDKMSSPNYVKDTLGVAVDEGGVHTNNGINNKAAYLMTDGDTFNGQTIGGIGADKVLAIYYEVNTNLLTSGSDYGDLYVDLFQACVNKVGGAEGITLLDCASVRQATDAVEMNGVPAPGYGSEAPTCSAGAVPANLFSDDLESGSANWSIYALTGPTRWIYVASVPGPWAPPIHSGTGVIQVDYNPDGIADAVVQMVDGVSLPANAYLRFAHMYQMNWYGGDPVYSGGVLEYSVDDGATWQDAGSLMDSGGYTGPIATGLGNPLAGRQAFVGGSHGYTSTRVALNSLAGSTVKFRWRLGEDSSSHPFNWWLDDISIYTCSPVPVISGNAGVPNAVLTYTDGTTKSVTADGTGHYSLPVSPNWTGTVTPIKYGYTFTPASKDYLTVSSDQGPDNYAAAPDVDLYIASGMQGRYHPSAGSSTPVDYPSLMNGPVKVKSVAPIFTSQVVASGGSYNEIMGYPVNQFNYDYWFPFYDHGYPSIPGDNMRTWVLVGNPSATDTIVVHITIGGVEMSGSPFSVLPGDKITPRWLGTVGGPVHVWSELTGITTHKFFTSERVFTVPYNSFNEMMGYPVNQFTTEYWFPWYDNINMQTFIKVGNTSSTQTANVDIYVGTIKEGSYTIPHDQTLTQSYPATMDGPVRVVSTNGVSVVASEWTLSGTTNSFNEVMGYPFNRFTNDYWFPYYDHGYPSVPGNSMRTWVLVGNPSATQTATVHITIGGTEMTGSPFSVGPGSKVTPRWLGSMAGAVHVVSDIPIFTSERVFTVPSNSFNEMMGFPASDLTTEYWFPWYDSINMPNSIWLSRP